MFDSRIGAEHSSAQHHAPAIVTVVSTAMQSRLDVALGELVRPVHVASIAAALTVVREQPVGAVLLGQDSVASDAVVTVGKLANTCGGAVIVVTGGWSPKLPQSLLTFGRQGVRETVDIGNRAGLSRLRDLVTRPEWELANRIDKTFEPNLTDATQEMRAFLHHLIHVAPVVCTIRKLASGMGIHQSSLTSRFYRARLPSPKKYLALVRLLYAAGVLEDVRVSAAQASRRLNYSSPQSFMRHVREQLGVSVHDFRERYSFTELASHVSFHTLSEHHETLRWFRPMNVPAMARYGQQVPNKD